MLVFSKSGLLLLILSLKDQKQFTEKRENTAGIYKQRLYCVSGLNPSLGLHFTAHLGRKFSPEVCLLLCTEHSDYVHPIQIPDPFFLPFSKTCAVIFHPSTLTVRKRTFERLT